MYQFILRIAFVMIVATSFVSPAAADDEWIQATYTIDGATVDSGTSCGDNNSLWTEVLAHRLTATDTAGRWYHIVDSSDYRAVSIDGDVLRDNEYIYWQPNAIGDTVSILAFDYLYPCHTTPPLVINIQRYRIYVPIITS